MLRKAVRILKQRLSPDIAWTGTFDKWENALLNSKGYDNDLIFDKVRESALTVRDKENSFERDGFIFDEIQINPPLLKAFHYIKLKGEKDALSVLDFGGSLGSVYKQHKNHLNIFKAIKWSIIEQDKFAEIGNRYFKNGVTYFYNNIVNFINENTSVDLVLVSSALQYVSEPYNILKELIALQPKFIIIDLTVIDDSIQNDIITIQTLSAKLYGGKVSYPCWLFGKKNLIDFLTTNYEVKMDEPSYIGRVIHKGKKMHYSFILLEKK